MKIQRGALDTTPDRDLALLVAVRLVEAIRAHPGMTSNQLESLIFEEPGARAGVSNRHLLLRGLRLARIDRVIECRRDSFEAEKGWHAKRHGRLRTERPVS